MSGWKSLALGEVMQLEYGKPLAPEDRNPTGLYPAYGANGEKDRTDRFYRDQPSIIVGRKGSAGEITLTEEKFWPLDVTYFAEFDRQCYDLKFLYYLLTTLELPSLAKGVKPGINRNEVYAVPVMVPPLHEQRRIVAILDEAFEAIATAKANAEKNLHNARNLFRSHLEQVFIQQCETSPTQPLEELTESESPITYGVVKPGDEGEVAFVRGGDIAQGRVLTEQLRTIDEAVSRQYRRTLLRGGELLISLVGQPGQVAVAPEELKGANIARQVGLIRLNDQIDAEYVRYFLQSPVGQAALGARQSGSVQQVINLGELRQVLVPVSALDVQRKVVAGLDTFSTNVARLTGLVQSKCDALDELKKSLLAEAFTGALTAKSTDKQLEVVA